MSRPQHYSPTLDRCLVCALSCYALLYREATGRKEGGIEIHHLMIFKKPKIVVASLGPMIDL